MANTARKNIKRTERNRKRQVQRAARMQKSIESIDYVAYLSKARRELPKNNILSYLEYLTARENLKIGPLELVKRQVNGGYTDKQIDARCKAHNKLWPEQNLTRSQFIKKRAWEDLEDLEKVLKAKCRAKGMPEDGWIIWDYPLDIDIQVKRI